MKKIITLILIALCIFGLVACSKNEDTINDYNENVEDIIGEANIEEKDIEDEKETSGDSLDIGLYSTENRAVFNFGNVYYLVYDFEGEKITDLNYYYTYENEEEAKLSYEYFKNALENNEIDSEDIKEVYQQDKYVILEAKEELYITSTKTEIMNAYSYIEQIYASKSGE